MLRTFRTLWNDNKGQGFIEYGLLIILVVLAIAPFAADLGAALGEKFQQFINRVGDIGG